MSDAVDTQTDQYYDVVSINVAKDVVHYLHIFSLANFFVGRL